MRGWLERFDGFCHESGWRGVQTHFFILVYSSIPPRRFPRIAENSRASRCARHNTTLTPPCSIGVFVVWVTKCRRTIHCSFIALGYRQTSHPFMIAVVYGEKRDQYHPSPQEQQHKRTRTVTKRPSAFQCQQSTVWFWGDTFRLRTTSFQSTDRTFLETGWHCHTETLAFVAPAKETHKIALNSKSLPKSSFRCCRSAVKEGKER